MTTRMTTKLRLPPMGMRMTTWRQIFLRTTTTKKKSRRLGFSLDDSTRCPSSSVREWRCFPASCCRGSIRRERYRTDGKKKKSRRAAWTTASREAEAETGDSRSAGDDDGDDYDDYDDDVVVVVNE